MYFIDYSSHKYSIPLSVPIVLCTGHGIIALCQRNQIMPIGRCDKSYRGLFSSRKQTCDPWKVIQEAINMSQIADNGPGWWYWIYGTVTFYLHRAASLDSASSETWSFTCARSSIKRSPCWQLNYETHQSKWHYQRAAAPSGRSDRASRAREQKTAK